MSEHDNNESGLQHYLHAHDGARDCGDGKYFAQIWMNADMTRDDLQTRINDIERTVHSGLHFTVLNCPVFDATDLVDDTGSFCHGLIQMNPMEHWEGRLQTYPLGNGNGEEALWEPASAEDFEINGNLQPYIYAEQQSDDSGQTYVTGVFIGGLVIDVC